MPTATRSRLRRRGVPWTAGGWIALVMLGAVVAGSGQEALPGLLVTVGEVTDRSAIVWARAPGPGPVEVAIGAPGSGLRRRLSAEASESSDFTVKLRVTDLAPGARHGYRIVWRGERIEGEFVTAPAPGTASPVRLLWGGDLGGAGRCRAPGIGYPIFRTMAGRHPDFFLFVGDTIYADQRCRTPENVPGADFRALDLSGYRAKHRYNRADPAAQAFFRSTSVYAIWDDHEVRADFAGPTEALMPVGRRAFLDYWPILPPAEDPYRLYRRVRWGRLAEVFILDTRQYRSANPTPDGPEKTMLGAAQRAWLVDRLASSDATWKLVVSSVPLSIPTGRIARDGWASGPGVSTAQESPTGFEQELLGILRALEERRVRNLLWLVSDIHRAEVIRHAPLSGLTFYEVAAGPLSAGLGRPGPLDETLNPTRLYAGGGYSGFGELEIRRDGLDVRILDGDGRVHFETTLQPAPRQPR